MAKLNFIDLPGLKTMDFDALGRALATKGAINDLMVWNHLTAKMKSGGFAEMLSYFEGEIQKLSTATEMLQKQIDGLKSAASAAKVNELVERNQQGNIKLSFAQLYSSWNSFCQAFLVSSIISTELWYDYQNVGSLVAEATVTV